MNCSVKDMQELPVLLTPKDLQALGFSKVVAYRMVNCEGFPKVRIGRKIVIPKADFIEWLNKSLESEVR